MMRKTTMTCVLLMALFAFSVYAGDMPDLAKGNRGAIYSVSAEFGKANRDTAWVIGPWSRGAEVNGQFQDINGGPAWNGWTSLDFTAPTETHWQVDTYHAGNLNGHGDGNLAVWCGDIGFDPCVPEDPQGGYGDNWVEALEWTGTVANTGESCTVNVNAFANIDTEPDFDYCYLSYFTVDGMFNQSVWDGIEQNLRVQETILYLPFEYVGAAGNEVKLQFRFQSDGGWSDEDCEHWTAGALQVDDIAVTLSNGGLSTFDDFEDGSMGNWSPQLGNGNGNYAKLWSGLQDLDPCYDNFSSQAAFIDDGIVVPGTGGTQCVSWCYGPGGYTLNNTGGLNGSLLNNAIVSPVATWPGADYVGSLFEMDIYRHEGLFGADDTGMVYRWWIRSTASEDPADIEQATWIHSPFIYYGGPDYFREWQFMTDNLVPGTQYVQMRIGVAEYGAPYDGNDGTPAPYIDNVRLIAYPYIGPAMSLIWTECAQDNFPDRGTIDFASLGNNDVRFDMANNISPNNHERNDPGDSVVIDCAAVRAGSELVGPPVMIYKVFPNPLFDAYRDLGEYGLMGEVEGQVVTNAQGTVVEDRFWFDLPDENFLYPGDIVHYYFEATDHIDGGDIQTTQMTGRTRRDTTGFSNPDPLAWNADCTMRALPTITEDPQDPGTYIIPKVLFWNDFGNRGGRDQWHNALANLGLRPGIDYDTFMTQAPSSGIGNGIGGRAKAAQLAYYDDLLYTCGDFDVFTLAYNDYAQDASDDIAQLTLWLNQGDKDMFMTGDGLIRDLANADPSTLTFMEEYLSLRFVNRDIRPLIDGQSAPVVVAEMGSPVFQNISSWVAYGGCRIINQFDAVEPINTASRHAQFTDANGAGGAYGYSAASLNLGANGNRSVTLPYDFMYIMKDPDETGGKAAAPLSARARLLGDVLSYFGIDSNPEYVSPVPGAEKFAVSNYPNPFNPSTKIIYTMPQRGHLTLKIYNVRGELVRTLIDEVRDKGSDHIMWDGTNSQGSQVSSGVYFYEARTGGDVQVQKMALVK